MPHELDWLLDVQPPVEPTEPPPSDGLHLNLGCGIHRKEGWVNVDGDPALEPDVCADALAYLHTLADDFADEIYAGHFLEHLEYEVGEDFLGECLRVLKPGRRLGVVVPDTRAIMRSYLEEGRDLDDLCRAFVYSTIQPSHHKWSYDLETLRRLLERVGFEVVAEIDRFRDPRLNAGAWWQCGLDAVKPQSGRSRMLGLVARVASRLRRTSPVAATKA